MSKQKLFDEESDDETAFRTENEYAKKYDTWREKEEMHKLEQKYGPEALTGEALSDSEDESDEPLEVSEETEAQFLKTLALLKTKDPRIYDPEFKFFDGKEDKEKESKPISKALTFDDSDSDDNNDGNIFTIEKKAEINMDKTPDPGSASKNALKEGKLKEYLTGKAEHVEPAVEQDLAPLKALWSDPKLNEGEAFLRDYILDKRYLDSGSEGEAAERLRDDEDLEQDERRVEEQGQFERAYNFRFEEPDDEYLKRYPRTMNSIRPKDARRSRARAEVRARKEDDKRRKMEEIARLKALKLKEIQQKIARIKEVTGNQDLAFKEEDLEGEFDPATHDRRMRAIFDEQYYGDADTEKPVFPDLDEELEIENWDKFDPESERGDARQHGEAAAPHCEDEDFNMDADYHPRAARATLFEQIKSNLDKKPRNRKRKSKLASLLAKEKPTFIPALDKTYAQHMEEYYAMDCEDVIGGDLPTRFKYREVVPNDFGLSVAEILLADDKELTQWVPLKRLVRHRAADVERSEVRTYALRAADVDLKRRVLPSLFKDLPEEPELVVPTEKAAKKRRKKNRKKEVSSDNTDLTVEAQSTEAILNHDDSSQVKKKNKKKHGEVNGNNEGNIEVFVDNSQDTTKAKKKRTKTEVCDTNEELTTSGDFEEKGIRKKKDKQRDKDESALEVNVDETKTLKEKKRKKKIHDVSGFIVEDILNVEPSQGGKEKDISLDKPKKGKEKEGKAIDHNDVAHKLKRKLEPRDAVGPHKKKHKGFKKAEGKGKALGKNHNKFKNKQDRNKLSDNPLSQISDERLKAYGLNPKKYRNFLKHKKF